MNFLKKLRKSRLDPKRTESVFQVYDDERGYLEYHEFCKTLFKRDFSREDDELTKLGLEQITIFDATAASHYLESILTKTEGVIQRENVESSEIIKVGDKRFLDHLFHNIFSASLDHKLRRYFESEYFLYWFTIFRSLPSPDSRRSFLWHCDKGPSRYLKILIYLNGSDEHGGNTTFLDRQMTENFVKTGYIFGPVDARQSDLSTLAKEFEIDYQPIIWPMPPGSAIVFEPSRVLHHGISPTRGARYVLMLCLLPSPIPWHEALIKTKGEGISEDYAWHESADEIRQTLLHSKPQVASHIVS